MYLMTVIELFNDCNSEHLMYVIDYNSEPFNDCNSEPYNDHCNSEPFNDCNSTI